MFVLLGEDMDSTINTITINGKEYVEAGSVKEKEPVSKGGMEYSIVRTYSAGVFAGWIDADHEGADGVVYDARRLWYWDGAASLSQLAVDGTCETANCKFPCKVERVKLTNIVEILPCTEKAKKSIEEVKVWER